MAARDRPTWLVAKREIVEATRTTSFRVTLVLSAVALAAIIVIANLGDDGPSTQDVVVAGPDAAGRVDGHRAARRGRRHRPSRSTTAPDDAAARAAVDDGDADVAVSADGTRLTTERARRPRRRLRRWPRCVNVLRANLALDNGLHAAGLTPEQAAAVRATPPPRGRRRCAARTPTRSTQPDRHGDDHQHPAVHHAADLRAVGAARA